MDRYNIHHDRIEYSLAFAAAEQDVFDETVCHELCHAVTRYEVFNGGHGPKWFALIRKFFPAATAACLKSNATQRLTARRVTLQLAESERATGNGTGRITTGIWR